MLRYGKQLTVSNQGDLLVTEESVFANFMNVKQVTIYTETVRVKDRKEVLAEYLKLLDRWKDNEIDLPAIKTVRDRSGNLRVEKSWTISS